MSEKKTEKIYGSTQWKRFRSWYRSNYPLCEKCLEQKKIVPGVLVDHITPISEGGIIFDLNNTQTLCFSCHELKKAKESKERVYSY